MKKATQAALGQQSSAKGLFGFFLSLGKARWKYAMRLAAGFHLKPVYVVATRVC